MSPQSWDFTQPLTEPKKIAKIAGVQFGVQFFAGRLPFDSSRLHPAFAKRKMLSGVVISAIGQEQKQVLLIRQPVSGHWQARW